MKPIERGGASLRVHPESLSGNVNRVSRRESEARAPDFWGSKCTGPAQILFVWWPNARGQIYGQPIPRKQPSESKQAQRGIKCAKAPDTANKDDRGRKARIEQGARSI